MFGFRSVVSHWGPIGVSDVRRNGDSRFNSDDVVDELPALVGIIVVLQFDFISLGVVTRFWIRLYEPFAWKPWLTVYRAYQRCKAPLPKPVDSTRPPWLGRRPRPTLPPVHYLHKERPPVGVPVRERGQHAPRSRRDAGQNLHLPPSPGKLRSRVPRHQWQIL